MPLAIVQEALADLRAGRFVILVDDEGPEQGGDLVSVAEMVTPEAVTFMARFGRGLICVAMTGERLDALQIPLMVPSSANTSGFGTAFTVSVEARRGVSTGISAADRATTIRTLVDPATRPDDLARPGHVFPLRCQDGGVLARAGQTEGSVDLARLAGLNPAAAICEIMDDDGNAARQSGLEQFSARHGFKIVSVAQVIAHRERSEQLIQRVTETRLPTVYGEFTAITYTSPYQPGEHFALVLGDVGTPLPVLARIHYECLTGDVLGSLRCDCGERRRLALERIAAEGRGVFLYTGPQGRGIELHDSIRACALQDRGLEGADASGVERDASSFDIGEQIFRDLGIRQVRLLTNNPREVTALGSRGVQVVERVPLVTAANTDREGIASERRGRMEHQLVTPGGGHATETDALLRWLALHG